MNLHRISVSVTHRAVALTTAILCCVIAPTSLFAKTRMIIILQEGMGHELLDAARSYSDDATLWDWRLDHNWASFSLATLPLSTQTEPDGSDPENLPQYDSLEAWNGVKESFSETTANGPLTFGGYRWLIENASDPRQSATALGTGTPTFNTSFNWMSYPIKDGSPIPPDQQLLEWAHINGLKSGLVSDMPFTNPFNTILAGVRTDSEKHPEDRFESIINHPHLDLYVAAGHPRYNELGKALNKPQYQFYAEKDWQDLRNLAREHKWDVIFGDENLIGVNTNGNSSLDRRLVVLQFGDTTETKGLASDSSGLSANLQTSLRFQTKVALDFLDQSEEGFVLVVHLGRLPHLLKSELNKETIEEVLNAFRMMVMCEDWVDSNGGWDETSLVLASPYEYGLIWGFNSSTVPFSQITNRGKNRLPGYRTNHKGPTASLTPILTRGAISQTLTEGITGQDPIYSDYMPLSKLGNLLKGFITKDE